MFKLLLQQPLWPRSTAVLLGSWLLLAALFAPHWVAAQDLNHYPQYQCDQNSADLFCQSFQKDSHGVNLLAAPGATAGHALGQLKQDISRQSLVFRAGRTGGTVVQFGEKILPNRADGDFFYEALLRPFANSTTDRETLYLTLQPANSTELYAVGLKAGSSIYTSKIELATIRHAQVTVLQEVALPLVLGSQDGSDGQWYLLRVERRQGILRVYLHNQLLLTDTSLGDRSLSHAGIWSYNRSFELDYLRLGVHAATGPQLTLQQLENQPRRVYQQQQSEQFRWQVSGVAASDIRFVNLTPQRLKIESDAASFRLHYLSPGPASLLLQSKSQPHVFKQIQLQIEPALSFPTTTAVDLQHRLSPTPDSQVPADTLLQVTFEQDIDVAPTGAARIYLVQPGQARQLVDEIHPGLELDAFGSVRLDKYRTVRRPLIWSQGRTLYIKPHSHRLQAGMRYQVELSAGLVQQNSGAYFDGIGKDAGWLFSTRPAPAAKAVLSVAADATADFATLQGALNFVMTQPATSVVQRIVLAAGIYHEPLYLTGVDKLTITGAGAALSQIEFSNYESLNSGLGLGVKPVPGHSAGGRSVFFIDDVAQLTLQQLSIKNLHQRRENLRNQAETIYFNSTGRLIALNSHFISEQDTLMLKGTSYFRHCLIAGNVDFIWGQNYLSLFDQNEIRSVGNSVKPSHTEFVEGSYILQARTISPEAPGFIFINNRFTSFPGPSGSKISPGTTFIARSAGRPAYVDQVLLLHNQFDSHIAAQGWAGPLQDEPVANPATPTPHSGWREYGSRNLAGQPLQLQQRKYGLELTADTLPYSSAKEVLQRHWPDFDMRLLTQNP